MAKRRLAAFGFALTFWLGLAAPLQAQDAPAATLPVDDKVLELLRLLGDPKVRAWIEAEADGPTPAASAAPTAPAPAAGDGMNPGAYLDRHLAAVRDHLHEVVSALPNLPVEIGRLHARISAEIPERGTALLLVIAFLGLGAMLEAVFWWATNGIRRSIVGFSLATSRERLRAAGIRLAFSLGFVLSFAIGSVGAFLAFEWPPMLRTIVLGYLAAFLVLRVALALGRFALAPGGERFRLVPMTTPAAWFWYRRLGIAIGWLALAWVTINLLRSFTMARAELQTLAYGLGLVLLLIGIEAWWRRPLNLTTTPLQRALATWLVTAYLILLWLLWVATAMPLFWLMVVLVGLPAAIRFTGRAVNHVLHSGVQATPAGQSRSFAEVCLDRGLRALLIIGAALLLAAAWDLDLAAMTMRDTLFTKLLRGVLSAVVIILVADFLWHAARAMIDMKLQGAVAAGDSTEETLRRRARLRTLLPILRNVLFVVIFAIAVLMVLSSLGIEIGPLIAGAGVVGVAVGFGAQTLVKDVISGMFYLLDDAFRVGEYISSGSYKGTVESFSLRSVKLRHHRGPLYTVPFGELGAVQNMSRDWVIDKLTIGVTYNTDLEKARKLIKEIGKTLAANPEYAPHIIEPLKMQGVESFGDYKIEISMKMMTKPGEQFTIRRKALAMIKQTFHEHGIEFAQPTVQVAGGAENITWAAAKQALDLMAPKPAEG